jgi:hypothetical protein
MKLWDNEFSLNVPEFEKSYVKQIVNAFTVYMVKQLKEKTPSEQELSDITDKFNNFLVILKLIRDDNNSCKQNLSNYHILQFQETLQKYNIQIE